MTTSKYMKGPFGAILVVLLAISSIVQGQNAFEEAKKSKQEKEFTREARYSTVGVSSNLFNYFGDLSPTKSIFSFDIKLTRPAFGLVYNYRLHPNFFLRGALSWGTLVGDDETSAERRNTSPQVKDRYIRNLHFRNRVVELQASVIYDIFSNRGLYLLRKVFTPYVFAGVAGFYHNPQAIAPEFDWKGDRLAQAGQWVNLRDLKLEDNAYSKFQFSMPLGIGVRARVHRSFDVAFEWGYRLTFTDYLDDVSNRYPQNYEGMSDLQITMASRALEQISARTGNPRDPVILQELANRRTLNATINGETAPFFTGALPDNNTGIPKRRGNPAENDQYWVWSLQVSYVIGSPIRKPKTQ